jgi:hypothetical protein
MYKGACGEQMWIALLVEGIMGQSFGNQFTLVEVVTDSSERQLWVVAARPDLAVILVLCAVPEGWTADTTGEIMSPEQAAGLNLKPGEVRELAK